MRRRTDLAVCFTLAAAVFLAAGTAGAAVTFDPTSGTGFVGKADVQEALGWKEGPFQANARRLSFHTTRYTAWTWECVIGAEVVTLTADQVDSRAVGSQTVASGEHKKGVTGFELTGLGAVIASTSDAVPATCPDGPPANVGSTSTDVLYLDLRDRSEPIWTN